MGNKNFTPLVIKRLKNSNDVLDSDMKNYEMFYLHLRLSILRNNGNNSIPNRKLTRLLCI